MFNIECLYIVVCYLKLYYIFVFFCSSSLYIEVCLFKWDLCYGCGLRKVVSFYGKDE